MLDTLVLDQRDLEKLTCQILISERDGITSNIRVLHRVRSKRTSTEEKALYIRSGKIPENAAMHEEQRTVVSLGMIDTANDSHRRSQSTYSMDAKRIVDSTVEIHRRIYRASRRRCIK